jgi:mannosyltransferase OCH1-like enzyme
MSKRSISFAEVRRNLPKTEPFGVSNDFMAATRGHALFQQLISSLKAKNHWFRTNYPTVLFSTGPMFVSQEMVKFLCKHKYQKGTIAVNCSGHDAALPVCILHPTLYSTSETSFFSHYSGSTWHGEDVAITTFFWNNKLKIATLLTVVLICMYGLGNHVVYNRSMGAARGWTFESNWRNT